MSISDWSSDVCSSDLRFAAAGAGDADAAGQFERRAVHGADQVAFAALEELPRRPVEAAAGVRADVEPGADGVAVAVQDQRFGVAVDGRFGLVESTVLDLCQRCQRGAAFIRI